MPHYRRGGETTLYLVEAELYVYLVQVLRSSLLVSFSSYSISSSLSLSLSLSLGKPDMHPRVRQMYKELLVLGSQHPTKPLPEVREEIKKWFWRNKDLEVGGMEWKKALAKGRYYGIRQMETLIHVHKYRAMKRRYEWGSVGDVF